MPSPFPGMDPYLEGYLWPDVHHSLAHQIRRQLTPALPPRYVIRLGITVIEDIHFETDMGVIYPDVELIHAHRMAEAAVAYPEGVDLASSEKEAPIPVTVPLKAPEVTWVTVEIHDPEENRLVTAIEVLSPVNKREPGLSQYQAKRSRMHEAGVHILEIDLLRRGTRTLAYPNLPNTAYRVTLIRAGQDNAQVWPIRLPDRLPTVPVPLLPPDTDVLLDLSTVLHTTYDEALYARSINYAQEPPPPAMTEQQTAWLRAIIANQQSLP